MGCIFYLNWSISLWSGCECPLLWLGFVGVWESKVGKGLGYPCVAAACLKFSGAVLMRERTRLLDLVWPNMELSRLWVVCHELSLRVNLEMLVPVQKDEATCPEGSDTASFTLWKLNVPDNVVQLAEPKVQLIVTLRLTKDLLRA